MLGYSVPLLVAAEFLGILCAAVFAGAAIYVNLVEHPARMSLDTRAAAEQWAPSYQRATLMQAPLAILSFLAGCTAWFLGGGTAWLIAALLIGVVVPSRSSSSSPQTMSSWLRDAILRRRIRERYWSVGAGFMRCAAS